LAEKMIKKERRIQRMVHKKNGIKKSPSRVSLIKPESRQGEQNKDRRR
jgi:hypothetical protein